MCIMRTYETRGRDVLDPPPRRGNYTSHPPAGVMRLPREWRREDVVRESVEYRYVPRSQPRVIGYIEEPRRSTTRARSVSRRRGSREYEYERERTPRASYVDERVTRRSVSRVRG
ncbi:hypothetical protein IQ07DRAFT_520607 [Pyrenochaeta sp. DS3sAY3a]|nr:hypothetical protein IQ07DRAFT_520607 [Pyrenochaeta sp. DS3sAY3a]